LLLHDFEGLRFVLVRILILKPSSLGDVVQALPVLRMLKLHLPNSQIFWWLSTDLLPLLQGDPDLAGIFPFERRRWASPWNWLEVLQSIQSMRNQKFDYVIDLQGLARSAIFSWLARGEMTLGLDDAREGARALYDIVVPRPSPLTHAVDWYLEVLGAMNVPVQWNFTWLPRREAPTASVLKKWPASSAHRWIVIHAGARWINKRWPLEFYQQLVRRITAGHPDRRIAILGGGDDLLLCRELAAVDPEKCLNLAGQTSLWEMIEWIRLSRLMISNDSGPMHIAAALGTPLIALFGPTEPRRTGPYRQIEHVLRRELACAPCMKSTCANARPMECLRLIEPAAVFERVRENLSRVE
jgi:heptosyltransferase I